MKPYSPYIPQTIGEVMEVLGWMMLHPPEWADDTGFFPGQSIDTEFHALREGLSAVRRKVGEERFALLTAKTETMRLLFGAEMEGDVDAGRRAREIIHEMEDLLTKRRL